MWIRLSVQDRAQLTAWVVRLQKATRFYFSQAYPLHASACFRNEVLDSDIKIFEGAAAQLACSTQLPSTNHRILVPLPFPVRTGRLPIIMLLQQSHGDVEVFRQFCCVGCHQNGML